MGALLLLAWGRFCCSLGDASAARRQLAPLREVFLTSVCVLFAILFSSFVFPFPFTALMAVKFDDTSFLLPENGLVETAVPIDPMKENYCLVNSDSSVESLGNINLVSSGELLPPEVMVTVGLGHCNINNGVRCSASGEWSCGCCGNCCTY
ncbi:hypothetical protein MA16_Dca028786 [Dendrobium catenatum]|uniref:Uncharacterized protein n=1 Tax=Dendrobium catenatum TaxID=906689 RepID=A0A2I0VCZ2_9ASPA|nr:hypothetical protein MA16_Dca028786 [Dendrobium catenatum]